ncbi:MAG TPA: S24/S26 family peptidase [Myxococcaceae bacterium]|nr:S24/S26 family peptidase [Myxococcaceae bacterium]
MPRDWTHAEHTEGLCWIPIKGDSMWPSLRPGDVAGVEPLEEAPRPGEVVVARFPHALVVHRVRLSDGSTCVLRGDNTPREDPPLPRARLLGRVRWVRRGGAVLAPGAWDRGPRWAGRWRVAVKRGLAALLRLPSRRPA